MTLPPWAGRGMRPIPWPSQLADCECALVDSLAAGAFNAGQTGGVQSFTNDGYSETRATAAESKAALRSLLGRYLTQPVNLLAAAGVCLCLREVGRCLAVTKP